MQNKTPKQTKSVSRMALTAGVTIVAFVVAAASVVSSCSKKEMVGITGNSQGDGTIEARQLK